MNHTGHRRLFFARQDRSLTVLAIYPALLMLLMLCGALGWSAPALATATINKQFTPATLDPGDISKFRISIFNSSLVPLTAAAVTDNLPANIKIASPVNVTQTCGFTSVTANPGTSQIILTGGTVPAGTVTVSGQCYFELDVVSTVAGNWVNTIPANGPSNGFTPGGTVSGFQATENAATITNATLASATLSVRGLSNPTGSKTFSPTTGLVGQPVALTIVLTNPNNSTTLPLTSFTDPLPLGMVVAPTPGGTVTCTGTGAVNGSLVPVAGASSLTLNGGVIGTGGTCTLTANVVVSSITGTSQSFTNTVPANAIGNTRGLTSATFNRSIPVNTPVAVSKSFSPTTMRAGQTGSLTINIDNSVSATVPLQISSFLDKLPDGLTIAASGTKTVTCAGTGGTAGTLTAVAGTNTITLTGATTGTPNRRCAIVVPVTAAAAGSYVNTTSNTGPDTVITNANVSPNPLPVPAASATLNVNSQFTVAKTVNNASAAPGGIVTFTVTISNWSSGAVGGVNFTDALPLVGGNQMTVAASGANLGAGCSGGTFSGAAGASQVTWTGGTVVGGSGANAGTCIITIPATVPAGAPIGTVFTNSIPVGSITGSGGIANTNAAAVNVTTVSAVSVTKAFSPTSVAQGQPSTLTVTLSNATAAPITGAALTDTLPTTPGAVLVAATPNASTTCAGGTVTAAPGSGSISIAGATIPGNGSCTFSAQVTGATVGAHNNTIPANALTSTGGATNPNPATAPLTITSGITGSKSFSPTAVRAGGVSRVTIQVNNLTPRALTNVSITDPLPNTPPNTLTIANPANATTTCAGSPVITATPGASEATLTGATLPAGGNCLFLFDVKTNSASTGNWTNTIPIGKITSAEGPQNTSAFSAILTRNTTTSIGVNKSFNPVLTEAGAPSVLRIDITNPVGSPSAANNVSLTDTLPVDMVVYPVPNASTTCANGVVTAIPGQIAVGLYGATLPAETTCSVFVNVTSTKFGNLTNDIPANAVTSTQGYTNTVTTQATLSTLAGLGASKNFTPTSISVGQTATLRIFLTNTRDPLLPNTQLTGVSFTDTLPTGLKVADPANATTTCTNGSVTANAGSNLVTLAGATVPPASQCVVQVTVTASQLGVLTNTIPQNTVSSSEGFINKFDGTASLNVLNPPLISKAFSPSPVKAGQASTLTVTLTNNNTQVLKGANLTDQLPQNLFIADPANATTTCSGGAVAAPIAGTSIALTNATLPANGSCTFRANVLSNTPGSYANTIPAGALTTAEGASNTAPANATLTVLQPPTVTKTFSPGTINTGQSSLLTLTLGNPNASALTLASPFIDTLPGILKVASPNELSGTCTLGSVTATPGGNTITYANGATIPPGGCSIAVNVTGNGLGDYVNLIPASGLNTNAGVNQTPANATLTLLAPVLGLAKSHAGDFTQGQNGAAYTLTVSNPGTLATSGPITVTDTLPTGLTYVSGTGAGWTCTAAGQNVTCTSSAVIPAGETGASITLSVNIAANAGGTLTNIAGASGGGAANTPTASVATTIIPAPVLGIAKSHAGPFVQGQSGTYTLTVSNIGSVDTSGPITVTDTLPAGLSYAAGTGSGWTCGVVGQTVTCTRGTAIASGGTSPITLTVSVASNAGSPLTNTATAAGGGAPNSPSASDSTPVHVPLGGVVFRDNGAGNGGVARDGMQNGTEPNFAVPTPAQSVFAVIVDSANTLLAVAQMCPSSGTLPGPVICIPGAWTGAVPPGTNYTAWITTTAPGVPIGQPVTPPGASTAPTGWSITKASVNNTTVQGALGVGKLTFDPAALTTLYFGVLRNSCPIPGP